MSRKTTIMINGNPTPLDITFRANSVNVNIRVDSQVIKASAPKGYPLKQIAALIEKNQDRIELEIRRQRQLRRRVDRQKQVTIVGRTYSIEKVANLTQAHCQGGVISIGHQNAQEQLDGFAYRQLHNYMAKKAISSGVAINGLRIGRYKSKWGSCNYRTRILAFNGELAFLPTNVIDYVFYHEIAHLKHPNHSADFWREVEGLMPDYQKYRKELKQVQI